MLSLRKYLKPFILLIILAIALLFVQAILDLSLPNLMSKIVNVGIQGKGIENEEQLAMIDDETDTTSIQMNYILKTGAQMLAMSLGIIIIAILVNYIATLVAKRLNKNLTKAVFEKVIQFSNKEFDYFLTSSLIT